MKAQLPLDVWITVLSFLSGTAVRSRRERSALTLVAMLQTSTLLREAASQSLLWKPIYEIRYEHCDEDRERTRNDTYCGDWRMMYAERQRIDNTALEYLDRLLESRAELRQLGKSVLELSMDVWDVFELEADCPLFSFHHDQENDPEIMPPHAFTRRFWAKSLLNMLSRNHAVSIWKRLWIPDAPSPTFEETMNALSCFFGYSNQRIARQLDQLAIQCREMIVEKGLILDPATDGYSTLELCQEICIFMQNKGFTHPNRAEYDDVMNRFPHAYLTTHRKAIPISLVHVFAAIGQRLALEISPLNFPSVVLAHVVPKELNQEPIIVNPSAEEGAELIVELSEAHRVYPASVREYFTPCTTQVMLLRASRNIISSFNRRFFHSGSTSIYPCLLLVLCTQLLADPHDNDDGLETLTNTLKPMASPLDCIFLLHSLSPMLRPRGQISIKHYCDGILDEEVQTPANVHRRSPVNVQYFIGMPCLNSSGDLCFLFAWDIVYYLDFEITPPLLDDRLERESYHLLKLDGTRQNIILPEGNVTPATFTSRDINLLLTRHPGAARYFSGVQLPKNPTKGVEHPDGRGRLLLSPQAIAEYPEDDKVGAAWVEHGFGNNQSPLTSSSETYPSLTGSLLIV